MVQKLGNTVEGVVQKSICRSEASKMNYKRFKMAVTGTTITLMLLSYYSTNAVFQYTTIVNHQSSNKRIGGHVMFLPDSNREAIH